MIDAAIPSDSNIKKKGHNNSKMTKG